MDAYLDDAIGDNSKLLVDLLRSLKKEEKILCGQVFVTQYFVSHIVEF